MSQNLPENSNFCTQIDNVNQIFADNEMGDFLQKDGDFPWPQQEQNEGIPSTCFDDFSDVQNCLFEEIRSEKADFAANQFGLSPAIWLAASSCLASLPPIPSFPIGQSIWHCQPSNSSGAAAERSSKHTLYGHQLPTSIQINSQSSNFRSIPGLAFNNANQNGGENFEIQNFAEQQIAPQQNVAAQPDLVNEHILQLNQNLPSNSPIEIANLQEKHAKDSTSAFPLTNNPNFASKLDATSSKLDNRLLLPPLPAMIKGRRSIRRSAPKIAPIAGETVAEGTIGGDSSEQRHHAPTNQPQMPTNQPQMSPFPIERFLQSPAVHEDALFNSMWQIPRAQEAGSSNFDHGIMQQQQHFDVSELHKNEELFSTNKLNAIGIGNGN